MEDEIAQYPKMVYPGGPDVKHTAAGSGVIVHSEAEEAWVMDGKPQEDFGKPEAPKAANWDKK